METIRRWKIIKIYAIDVVLSKKILNMLYVRNLSTIPSWKSKINLLEKNHQVY